MTVEKVCNIINFILLGVNIGVTIYFMIKIRIK